MSLTLTNPWWMTDAYTNSEPLPDALKELAGPHGIALVEVFTNGSTQEGWGLTGKDGKQGFMARYEGKEFNPRIALWKFNKRQFHLKCCKRIRRRRPLQLHSHKRERKYLLRLLSPFQSGQQRLI